jgi:3-oxoacyl-[acyl-carrier-protein] synthase II
MTTGKQLWITGVSAVTPLGSGFATFAREILAGRSGVTARQLLPDQPESTQIVAAVDSIPRPPSCDASWFAGRNRLEQLGLSCAAFALHDAGLWEQRASRRIGLVLGLGAEWLRQWELDALNGGDRVLHPNRDAASMIDLIQAALDLSGPAVTVAAACASGNYALAVARRWIERGCVDVCLAGGCDLITPMAYAGFHNLRALSRRTDAPQAASRPFDRDRDGFVLGEGGSMLAIESSESARRRGARVYAEVAGFGATSDATHMIIPNTDPRPAAQAIRRALEDARVASEEVDYVNAHATSTPAGDPAEARALRLALGSAASRTPVSSTKSMTGHLLSGSASIEALACLAALEYQALPPTINLDTPDPECDLMHVRGEACERKVRVAVSNSFGFGGSNTCLVLRKVA